jgi:hypothetical protein
VGGGGRAVEDHRRHEWGGSSFGLCDEEGRSWGDVVCVRGVVCGFACGVAWCERLCAAWRGVSGVMWGQKIHARTTPCTHLHMTYHVFGTPWVADYHF